jgi:hypothetical protein
MSWVKKENMTDHLPSLDSSEGDSVNDHVEAFSRTFRNDSNSDGIEKVYGRLLLALARRPRTPQPIWGFAFPAGVTTHGSNVGWRSRQGWHFSLVGADQWCRPSLSECWLQPGRTGLGKAKLDSLPELGNSRLVSRPQDSSAWTSRPEPWGTSCDS